MQGGVRVEPGASPSRGKKTALCPPARARATGGRDRRQGREPKGSIAIQGGQLWVGGLSWGLKCCLDPDRVHSAFFVINMMDHHVVVGKGILLEKFPPPMSGVRALQEPEDSCRTGDSQGQFLRLCLLKMPCYLGKCTK